LDLGNPDRTRVAARWTRSLNPSLSCFRPLAFLKVFHDFGVFYFVLKDIIKFCGLFAIYFGFNIYGILKILNNFSLPKHLKKGQRPETT